jgi:hypothetical protein
MATKEKKSASELTFLIMGEVKKHPDWNDIMSVAITRPVQSAAHHPNWDAAFTMDGQRVAPEEAFGFVNELQRKYDLEL